MTYGKGGQKPVKRGDALIWDYLGIKIEFDGEQAAFRATAGGKSMRAASLDAIVSRIDKLNLTSFEPFDALVQVYNYSERIKGHVVSRVTTEGRSGGRKINLVKIKVVALDESHGKLRFRDEHGDEYSNVYEFSDATIKAWNDLQEAERIKAQREEQLLAEVDDAREVLKKREVKAAEHISKIKGGKK